MRKFEHLDDATLDLYEMRARDAAATYRTIASKLTVEANEFMLELMHRDTEKILTRQLDRQASTD